MHKQAKSIITAIFLLNVVLVFSQRKASDTLQTGVIDVVKPYTPTVSDAFKVKETPPLDDETTQTKKEVKYNIFSFPVASTFTPAKGKAAVIEKAKPVKLYDNYATLGLGSYTSILGEVYLNYPLSRNESLGGYVSHHSSGGEIENVQFKDNFSNSKLNINYSSKLRYLSWNAEAGFQHQMYNWYGVPESQVAQAQTNNIDTGHAFFDAFLGGDVSFEDTYINSGSLLLRRFSDNQGSAENRLVLKGKVDIPVNYEEISTELKIDYLGGEFDRSYFVDEALDYGNFIVSVSPTYQLKQDDLTLNLGVSLAYLNDRPTGDSKFYVYPNITASYRLVNDVLIAYGGIQGDLIQNSYHGFANENPFVSPTLLVMPTDQLYNAYVGLKGKLSSNMNYNISGKYISDRNKALYKTNVVRDLLAEDDYNYGNSFGMVYDDVDTFGISGEINVDVNRNFKLGLKAEYLAYDTDGEAEAWNLPNIKGSLFADYQIDENWFAGANLFFVGERKDILELESSLTPATPTVLDSYFDANIHVGYHINEQFSIYAKVNNLTDKAYQKWQNFPVQSIQLLAGATYKFDF